MGDMTFDVQGFAPLAALQTAALDALRAELVALGLVLPGQADAAQDRAVQDAAFDAEFDNLPV